LIDFCGEYTWEACRQCGGTGKPEWPDAIGLCIPCGGDGQVRVYLDDDQDDDEEP
jgi:hypothetical protein